MKPGKKIWDIWDSGTRGTRGTVGQMEGKSKKAKVKKYVGHVGRAASEICWIAHCPRKIYPFSLSEKPQLLTKGVRSMLLSTLAFFLANVFVKQVAHQTREHDP